MTQERISQLLERGAYSQANRILTSEAAEQVSNEIMTCEIIHHRLAAVVLFLLPLSDFIT